MDSTALRVALKSLSPELPHEFSESDDFANHGAVAAAYVSPSNSKFIGRSGACHHPRRTCEVSLQHPTHDATLNIDLARALSHVDFWRYHHYDRKRGGDLSERQHPARRSERRGDWYERTYEWELLVFVQATASRSLVTTAARVIINAGALHQK